MNIPIPSPPTDSLYKFMALLGAIMFIVAVALPSIRKQELHTQYTDKIDKLNVIARELQSAVDLDKPPEERNKTREIDRAAGFVMGEAKNLSDWLKQRQEIAAEQDSILYHVRWSGLAIAILGFVFWYVNVQRWDDRMKKLEVERKQLEIQSGKQEPTTASKKSI